MSWLFRAEIQSGRSEVLAQAGRGEHATIADERDAGDAEALADGAHLGADGGGIGGVAGEHLDGNGAAVGGSQQAADDLALALLAVAVVAEGGQGGRRVLPGTPT